MLKVNYPRMMKSGGAIPATFISTHFIDRRVVISDSSISFAIKTCHVRKRRPNAHAKHCVAAAHRIVDVVIRIDALPEDLVY